MPAGPKETVVDRVRNLGVRASTPLDLIAVGFTRSERDAEEAQVMSRSMWERFQIHGFAELSFDHLREIAGLQGFEAARCLALLELGRRAGASERGAMKQIDHPSAAFELLKELRRERQEHFVALLLNAQNQLLRKAVIHIGTLNASLVGPREVFREAIREGASCIIVAHNHPSGDPTPSPEDIEVTKRLIEIGNMLDIPVLDHVIIGYDSFKSLQRMGLM